MLQFVSQFAFLVSTKLDVADDSRELTSCHVSQSFVLPLHVNCQFSSLEFIFQWTPSSLVPGSQNAGFCDFFSEVAGVQFPSPNQQENWQCQSVEGLCSLRECEWEGILIAQLSLMI